MNRNPSWEADSRGPEDLPPPVQVDGFADIVPIGHGAFASVYRAVEIGTDRPVALKLLDAGTMQPHLIENFHAEVRALATVSSHPNIVTLYRGVAMADGRPVLVLELCRGSYLQRARSVGPLEAGEVVNVGIKIAGALETAHRAGYLHRDLKPQNILVTQFGEPALADFGVATLAASALATEASSGFTTLHAAPEVLEGTRLSPATDVYGLASTLYQLLTGSPPFSAFEGQSPASAILRILHEPPAPITRFGVPISLSDALVRALAKDPSQRPATATSFADLLREVEREAGWPLTPYLVWGDEPSAPTAEMTPFWTAPSTEPPAHPPVPSFAPPAPSSAREPGSEASPAVPAALQAPGVVTPEAGARLVLDPAGLSTPRISRHQRRDAPVDGPARPDVAEMPLPAGPPRPPVSPAAGPVPLSPPPSSPPLPPTFSFAPPATPPPEPPAPPREMVSTGWPDLSAGAARPEAVTWAPSGPADPLDRTVIPALRDRAAGPTGPPPPAALPVRNTTAIIVGTFVALSLVIVLVVLAVSGVI